MLNNALAMLRLDPGQPDHLLCLFPVDQHVGCVFVATDMGHKVDSCASGPLIIGVAVEPQWPQMALELAFDQGCRDTAAGIASSVGAEEDDIFVLAGSGGHLAASVGATIGFGMFVRRRVDEAVYQLRDIAVMNRIDECE